VLLRVTTVATVVALVGLSPANVGAVPAADPAPDVPRYHPARLAHVADTRQVVVVTAPGWRSTRGTLRTYERAADGTWTQVLGDTPAWLGAGGLVRAEKRRQGTGTTPAGTFALPSAFGRRGNPGTAMPYVQFDRNDAWPYDPGDPATYNVFQHEPRWKRWSGGYVEHLWRLRDQYRYVAVLDYNLPAAPYVLRRNGLRTAPVPADTRRGGGIFLHVDDDRPTAGCVAIPVGPMREVLRWLDPAANPVIVIGPRRAIGRL
jgi:L,D-peptidoglycan transpeptidase YkuD (ErfK/YbiS/YcfS/YnhG family)